MATMFHGTGEIPPYPPYGRLPKGNPRSPDRLPFAKAGLHDITLRSGVVCASRGKPLPDVVTSHYALLAGLTCLGEKKPRCWQKQKSARLPAVFSPGCYTSAR